MANPLSVAALTDFPVKTNIIGLPSNQAKGVGSIGVTLHQYFDDNVAPLQFRSGTGTSGVGTASLYLVTSEDGVHWTDGIDPVANADQSAKLGNALAYRVFSNPVNADATLFFFREFSVVSKLGFMPTYWSVVFWNQSGAAFDGTAGNFILQHSLVDYA